MGRVERKRLVSHEYSQAELCASVVKKMLSVLWDLPGGHATVVLRVSSMAPTRKTHLLFYVVPYALSTAEGWRPSQPPHRTPPRYPLWWLVIDASQEAIGIVLGIRGAGD